jgi:transposase
VAGVMIGIDPHKGSHTTYALDEREQRVGQVRVRASSKQVEVLLDWAGGWPQRTWAVEGARGLGQLLSQQLLGAGERVLDVQPSSPPGYGC